MTLETIEQDFRKKVCAQIRLEPEGINRSLTANKDRIARYLQEALPGG